MEQADFGLTCRTPKCLRSCGSITRNADRASFCLGGRTEVSTAYGAYKMFSNRQWKDEAKKQRKYRKEQI